MFFRQTPPLVLIGPSFRIDGHPNIYLSVMSDVLT